MAHGAAVYSHYTVNLTTFIIIVFHITLNRSFEQDNFLIRIDNCIISKIKPTTFIENLQHFSTNFTILWIIQSEFVDADETECRITMSRFFVFTQRLNKNNF